MTILLTGAAGFIGMHVAQLLLTRGDEVVGVDNLNSYYDPDLKLARLAILNNYFLIHLQKINNQLKLMLKIHQENALLPFLV